jgi:hypothetical protein
MIHMKRYALLAAGVMALGALVPAGLAAEPNGNGLFREHPSVCTNDETGQVVWSGAVTLTRGGGASFWAGDLHLVILSAEITPDGGSTPFTIPFGQKTGQARGGTVTCKGHFDGEGGEPGYGVVSHDVVVP